ncbi:MAG TPA: DUF6655 family protein [Humisphaera sp.]
MPEPSTQHPFRRPRRLPLSLLALALLCVAGGTGCATVRVTDTQRTATEQFLVSGSIQAAVAELSMDGLRDQLVYVDQTYLTGDLPPGQSAGQIIDRTRPMQDLAFLVGELRARMLKEGVRITGDRNKASVVLEVRSGGAGIDRYEFLLGLPASTLTGGGASTAGAGGIPIATPEIALLKSTRQLAFSSVAIVAYRQGTGELVAQSGPFVGRKYRGDYWIFGTGPNTVGDVPPAEEKSVRK